MIRNTLLTLLLVTAWAEPAGAVLLNGTAAAVGKVLITVRDAQFFSGIQRVKDGKPPGPPLEEKNELRQTVQKMAVEEMVLAEMKSFQVEAGSRSEAERIVSTLKARGKDSQIRELLSRYGKSENALVDAVWKSLKVEKFLQRKVETLTPLVTEAEAERYFKANQAKFFGSNFEALKPTIILALKKEGMQKGLEEWIRSLRDKHGLINLLPD